MTLRRLRWLLLPLLAAVALAVVILPPRPLPQRFVLVGYLLGFEDEGVVPNGPREHIRILRVSRERLRGVIAARTHGAADVHASHDARALRSMRDPIVVVRDADVPEAAGRTWLSSAERELGFFPRASGAGVPVIVALHTRDPQSDSSGSVSYASAARFQFTDGAERACIVDIVLPRKGEAGHGRFDVPNWLKGNVVGRCGFYARYGFPGPGVRRWAGLESRWTRYWTWFAAQRLFAPSRGAPDTVAWRAQFGGVPWRALTCLRGTAANCGQLVGLTAPSLTERAEVYYYYFSGQWSEVEPRRVAASLITQRGPERFASFWTSPLPADSALHATYGVPAEVLVRDVLSHLLIPAPAAQPPAVAFLVSLGWVLALAGVAMGLSWRREMDV